MSDTPTETISRREANWYIHLAGQKAAAAARASGEIPEADALLNSSVGLQVNGNTFPPIPAAFLLLIPRIDKLIEKYESDLAQESGTVMLMAYLLVNPEQAWSKLRSINSPEAMEAFEAEVFEFSLKYDVADLGIVSRWIAAEMARLKSDATAAEVGK